MTVSTPALNTSYGKPFCISARSGLTGSVYLVPDTPFLDNVENQAAQTWIGDPIQNKNKDNAAILQWHINSNDDGTYTIRTNPSWWHLTFDLDKDPIYARIVSKRAGGKSQRWHFTSIASVTSNTYVISSAENPQYYMTRENETAIDNYVIMRRMWDGGIPNPIISTWYVTPVPLDIQERYPPTTEPPG